MESIKTPHSLSEINAFINAGKPVVFDNNDWQVLDHSVDFLNRYLAESSSPVYGVNTGFGSLQNVQIDDKDLSDLQQNLLITHAAGVGEYLSQSIVKKMLLLKILNIKKGYSAVRREIVERLIFLYNNNLIPVVHSQGSLGASGDLAPLAEMSLPLIGMGKIWVNNTLTDAKTVLKNHNLQALTLGPKEALALINGTQFMLAHALEITNRWEQLSNLIPHIAALSCDVFLCRKDPFQPELHRIRPHSGQIKTAQQILDLLDRSPLQEIPRPAVQDPYSFRCIPQVNGASLDALQHCLQVWETELNSVTDNPNVFSEENKVLSGGNFHGQPLALTLDYAAMALSELASISERRIYLLMSGQRQLPAYLANNAGLDSGYMIAQYTAASLASQNKQLCTPASVDSIMSSNGQEDHVSMGSNAALKLVKVMENVKNVFAIEFICAKRALQLRNQPSSPTLTAFANRLEMPLNAHEITPMNELIAQASQVLFG